VATDSNDYPLIFENEDIGADHYAGVYYGTVNTLSKNSASQIAIFKTPENWNQMNLYSGTPKTKRIDVNERILALPQLNNGDPNTAYKPDQYENIFINPYTGRIIRANQ
jgi:hypothetical protein